MTAKKSEHKAGDLCAKVEPSWNGRWDWTIYEWMTFNNGDVGWGKHYDLRDVFKHVSGRERSRLKAETAARIHLAKAAAQRSEDARETEYRDSNSFYINQ